MLLPSQGQQKPSFAVETGSVQICLFVAGRTRVGMHRSGRVPECVSVCGLLDRAAGLVLLGTRATWPPSTHACDSSHSVLRAESSSAQEQAGEDLARRASILLRDLSSSLHPNNVLLSQNLQGHVFSISDHLGD